ncbi:MAG: hypothetical protein ACFCD0_15135 [Gemmataceae bacterium]
MGFFEFFRWVLIITISVSYLVPINIPLAALAYRIQIGTQEMEFETDALWWRSTGMSLGLAVISFFVMYVDFFLTETGIPVGMIHVGLVLLYLPACVWYSFWIFAFDELYEGLSLFVIYLLIPGLLIAVLLSLGFELPPMTWLEGWIPATELES